MHQNVGASQEGMEWKNEGSGIGKENLHEVQDCSSARRGARDLYERQAPPAPGIGQRPEDREWLA
jgi:hypothetical protein